MEGYEILVSIYCLTYNHEKYIRQALEGFVNQITKFKYEIIVHDDASTDGTARIIAEYAKKYPDIIKPIFQTDNQYSLKKPIVAGYIADIAVGKYIAACEGDDYWTDPHKLQKQVDVLEAHPECNFCVHKVEVVDESGNSAGYSYPSSDIHGGVLSSKEFIGLCTEYTFQTSSYMFRRDQWYDYYKNPPEFRKGSPIGDIPLQLYFGNLAPVYYIKETMSCYRRGVPTSSTVRQANATSDKKIEFARKMRVMFERYDEFTEGKYHDICINRISRYSATEGILSCNAKALIKNHEIFGSFDTKRKAFILFSAIFPQKGKTIYEKRLTELGKRNKVL